MGQQQHFTDRGKAVWDVLRDHYHADPGLDMAHRELFGQQLGIRYPRHADDYAAFMEGLDLEPPVENLVNVLVEGRKKGLGRDMAIALAEEQYEDFETLLSAYRDTSELEWTSDTIVGADLSDLLAVHEAGNRIPLGPSQLNVAMRGGALPGHNVLLFGRPEIGKSALALGVVKAAAEAGYRVGYWENEDPLVETQLRLVCALCAATEEQVRVNSGRYRGLLERAGYYDRIFFRESPDGTISEIDAWVEKHEIDIVIINQMVNLRSTGESRTLVLSEIARGQRAIAKRQQCVVVGVAQAGESAVGRAILRLEDLEWSNTGVQATLDLMVGIGADEGMLERRERVLSLCKNKLGGNHRNIPVDFDQERSLIS